MKLVLDEETIQKKLSEFAEKVINNAKCDAVSDWITEDKASKLLGYGDLPYLRDLARNNNIKISQRGRKYYYSLGSINEYINGGVVEI